jgi:hypothetical protein
LDVVLEDIDGIPSPRGTIGRKISLPSPYNNIPIGDSKVRIVCIIEFEHIAPYVKTRYR